MSVLTDDSSNKRHNYIANYPRFQILHKLFFLGLIITNNAFASNESSREDWINAIKLGGDFSVFSYGRSPYNRTVPYLSLNKRKLFSKGADTFNRDLIDYLESEGYQYLNNSNSRSCQSCHFRDGRGRSFSKNIELTGFSIINKSDTATPLFLGEVVENDTRAALIKNIKWKVVESVKLSDEELVELVRPVAILNGTEVLVDLRNGPAVFGLGLIEAISNKDILETANNSLYEKFGVKGIVNHVGSDEERIGKFGAKARFDSLPSQVRSALSSELGVHEPTNINFSNSEKLVYEGLVEVIVNYLRLLAVPARRVKSENQINIQSGAKLFKKIGCVMCHKPEWKTMNSLNIPEIYREQLIYPFSDFLLHDLGDGLSDSANNKLSNYWRTAPLWGIGMQKSVSIEAGFMHDGRARNFTEAILWHGGEATYSKEGFKRLSKKDRKHILEFLSSL